MKAADSESVFQLLIGLNLAIYTFKELRTPAVEKFESEIAKIRSHVTSVNSYFRGIPDFELKNGSDSDKRIAKELSIEKRKMVELTYKTLETISNSSPINDKIINIDDKIRNICMVIGAIDFGILIYASIYPDYCIRIRYFVALVIASSFPIVMAILFNIAIHAVIKRFNPALADLREQSKLMENYALDVSTRMEIH